MAKVDTAFVAKKGDMEIDCKGYTADEIKQFLTILGGNPLNLIAKDLPKEYLDALRASFAGDLSEVVSFNEKDKPRNEEIDLERTLKTAKLPTTTSNFTCPNCDQSILLVNNGHTLVRDYKDKKLYDIGEVTFPNMLDEDETTINDKMIEVYKDCLNAVDRSKTFVLVTGSDDTCSCPVCNHVGTVGEFVKYNEDNYDDEICDMCGCEKEMTISQNGENYDCANHCMKKLIEDK